jgi:phenylpropionate dioxygenase-like ring-hydroxylating dioxygenase large terminal subunit
VSVTGRSPEEILCGLRRSWFPVARLEDLARPAEATLLGERLVVFRTDAGEPRILQRRCVHRGGNLAKGEVHGDVIACPYHGWRYDGATGWCTHIPSLPEDATKRIPSTARVESYPAHAQWGLVWTCLDEPLLAPPDPAEFHELELGEWVAGPTLHSTIGLAATTENFRDVAHFPFVHRGTMGEVPHTVEPLDVRRDGFEVWMTRRVEAVMGAPWSGDGDAWMHYHALVPGVSIIVYDYDKIGKRVLVGCPSPMGYEECTIFWAVANDASFTGMTVQEAMESEHAVYLEDVPVIGDLEPREVPFDGEVPEVSVPSDKFTLGYRRAYLDFIAAALDANLERPLASQTASV